MRSGLTFGLALAAAVLFGGMAYADGPWESYGKHMSKYHHHMAEAAEEAEEGDWEDYCKEMNKAQAHAYAADFNRRIGQSWIAPSYVETRTYYTAPRYTQSYSYERRTYISYGPGYSSEVTVYSSEW